MLGAPGGSEEFVVGQAAVAQMNDGQCKRDAQQNQERCQLSQQPAGISLRADRKDVTIDQSEEKFAGENAELKLRHVGYA